MFVAAAVLACIQSPALAADGIRVEAPWARATPPGTPMGAAYLTIVNNGDAADRLVGAATPVAERVQLHRSVEADGESRMRRQSDGVPVPAGARVPAHRRGAVPTLPWHRPGHREENLAFLLHAN